MADARLVFVPLGGAGEIGMNMYAYGIGAPGQERWILVDVGVTFPNMDSSPGVDLIMADPEFIEQRKSALEAIFITHAHEDHVGALGHLGDRFDAPIYTRRFTGLVAREKMERNGLSPKQVKTLEPFPAMVEAGPFKVGFLPVPHSIPEASGLVIDSAFGRVVHSGDLKLDPNPQVGEAYNPELFKDVAKDGVRALVCDSTNVFTTDEGRSEADIVENITDFMRNASGMVVATTFASNIARLQTLARAAEEAGRSVLVLGRAMNRMLNYAREAEILGRFPKTVSLDEARDIPRDQLFVLATGSQGEMRAATAQLARDSYHGLEMKSGDTYLFSSMTIPGNEVSVARILNNLALKDVTVAYGESKYHVSGHANRPDILKLHELFNPDLVVPMHGEYRHLREHAKLAQQAGRRAAVADNGTMIDLISGQQVDEIKTGRLYLDGSVLIGALDGIVRDRIRMAIRGQISVSVVIDEDGVPMEGSWVSTIGLASPASGDLEDLLEDAVEAELSKATKSIIAKDSALEDLVTRTISRAVRNNINKKPIVRVLINRLA